MNNHFKCVVFQISYRLSVMQKEKVYTVRYVYHMTDRKNRLSIKKKGIIASACEGLGYSNAVFAHNSAVPTLYWYPFVNSRFEYVDIAEHPEYYFDFDSVGSSRDFAHMTDCFDIWEIDTLKLGNEWYLDHAALSDFGGDIFGGKELYVFTYGNITVDCIRLVELSTRWKRTDLDGVSITGMFFELK